MNELFWNGREYEDVTVIKEMYQGYRLTITYHENFAQVSVEDLGERIPLIFSQTMTKEKANSYLQIFRNCGYVEII